MADKDWKGEDNDIEEDEFELEMQRELDRRIKSAEIDGGIDSRTAGNQAGTSQQGQSGQDNQYDNIYFDSDEEDDGEKSGRKLKTNDELLYDPNQDDEDQAWVDQQREDYLKKRGIATPQPKRGSKPQPLPNSDAVLNCPACFNVLCLDCQRHEVYQSQYRAMFVMNCSVDESQKLKFPLNGKKSGKKKAKLAEASAQDDGEDFNPVRCDECSTEVGVYDSDEIYHFFNVMASHS